MTVLRPIAFEAMAFARQVHRDQVRKYTGNPYADHLAEVAGIVATVAPPADAEEMIAAGWLHDCVEDQDVTITDIELRFGCVVACWVETLSDLEPGNRAERKAASRARLGRACREVQTIKCADLISNTSSIVQHDPKFAKVYLAEKLRLLDVMRDADPRLWNMAQAQANAGLRALA